MTATRTVKPNKNLKAMLEEHPEARAIFERTKSNSFTSLMNAFANVYIKAPELAFVAFDLILRERGITPQKESAAI